MFYIRESCREDFKRGRGLVQTLNSLSLASDLDNSQLQDICQALKNDGSILLVVISGCRNSKDQIVGTVKLFFEKKIFRGGSKVCHLEDLAVRNGFERRGIGQMLIKTAQKIAKKEGCYKTVLYCDDKLIGFYNKYEFVQSKALMTIYL